VGEYKELWERLDIAYDAFIRTTDKQHEALVTEVLKRVWDKVGSRAPPAQPAGVFRDAVEAAGTLSYLFAWRWGQWRRIGIGAHWGFTSAHSPRGLSAAAG
jgi:hypothetical protein